MENQNNNKRNKLSLFWSQSHSSSTTVENINDFPDEILTHLLSFLPTREAFRTTVLSKRWRPLSYSLSDLVIDDQRVQNSEDLIQFRQFMDAVMFSTSLTLKSFHLSCFSKLWETEGDCFDKWVEVAKHRHIEVLRLHFSYSLYIPLAPTIFCCKTLVNLTLAHIRVAIMFHCSADLPLLKTLCLTLVKFEDMKDFMNLLSGCPILEYLHTIGVESTTGITVGGCIKPLPKLIKAYIFLFDVPFRALQNVQSLRVHELERILNEEINSYYKGFPVFENLTNLHLKLFQGGHVWHEVVKMLQSCPKLQTLRIEKCLNSTTIEGWEYPDHVPKGVSSHLTTCQIINYDVEEPDFRFAAYILQNAKLLRIMTIFHTLRPKPTERTQFLDDLSSCPTISPTFRQFGDLDYI